MEIHRATVVYQLLARRDALPRNSMQHVTMTISGMSCGGCVSTVEHAIRALPGAHVDAIRVGQATVSFDPSQTSRAAIAQAVTDAGYTPHTGGAPAPPTAQAMRETQGGCCGGGGHDAPNDIASHAGKASAGKSSSGSGCCS